MELFGNFISVFSFIRGAGWFEWDALFLAIWKVAAREYDVLYWAWACVDRDPVSSSCFLRSYIVAMLGLLDPQERKESHC